MSQRLTGDVLHRHERAALVFSDVVDDDDVRVAEARDGSSFAQEALAQFGVVLEIFFEEFDGDEPIQLRIPGQVQRTHAAAAKATLDLVPSNAAGNHGGS
jgi:hypothetical protein